MFKITIFLMMSNTFVNSLFEKNNEFETFDSGITERLTNALNNSEFQGMKLEKTQVKKEESESLKNDANNTMNTNTKFTFKFDFVLNETNKMKTCFFNFSLYNFSDSIEENSVFQSQVEICKEILKGTIMQLPAIEPVSYTNYQTQVQHHQVVSYPKIEPVTTQIHYQLPEVQHVVSYPKIQPVTYSHTEKVHYQTPVIYSSYTGPQKKLKNLVKKKILI